MKNLFKSAALVAALAMASCATQEELVPVATADDAINFGIFMDQATKATIFDNEAMQESGFGIMGYYTSQDGWNVAGESTVPNFMWDQEVVYNSIVANGWGYDPVQYWSNKAYDKYSFFAYAPYSGSTESGITLSANDVAGAPVASFVVNSDPKKMVDFVAGQEINVEQQVEAVKFNLKHQLTRVTFSANTNIAEDTAKNTDATKVVVTRMDLVAAPNFYQSGDYTFDNADTTGEEDFSDSTDPMDSASQDHTQDGVWSNLKAFESVYPFSSLLAVTTDAIKESGSAKTGYTTSGVRVTNSSTVKTPLFTTDEYLFLLPPNGQKGIQEGDDVAFEIEYQIVTANDDLAIGYSVSDPKISTVSLPLESLKQGRAYDIVLTIGLTEVKVEAVVIDWDESEENMYGSESGYGENPIAIEEISFDSLVEPIDIKAGETLKLSYTLFPSNANENITWTSSNESIATVDAKGVVTGLAKGQVLITATANGTFDTRATEAVSATIEVNVYGDAESATLVPAEMTLDIAGTDSQALQLTYPEYSLVPTIDWSFDSSIVKVENNVVTGLAIGETTITATVGSSELSCKVTVINTPSMIYMNPATEMILEVGANNTQLSWAVGEGESTPSETPEWTSSNEDVATVDSEGNITTHAAGTAVITVTVNGLSAKCTITVESTDIDAEEIDIIVAEGETTPIQKYWRKYHGQSYLLYRYIYLYAPTYYNEGTTKDDEASLTYTVTPDDATGDVKWSIVSEYGTASDYVTLEVNGKVAKVTYEKSTGNYNYVTLSVVITNADGSTENDSIRIYTYRE